MKRPPNKCDLTASYLREYFSYNPNTGIFTRRIATNNSCKVGDVAGGLNNRGYISLSIRNRVYPAHRLAWLYMTGSWPESEIDHIDGKRDNNIFTNLREATPSQNGMNKKLQSNNQTGVRGVSLCSRKKKWVARIKYKGKTISLGSYSDLESAALSRKAKEEELYGEYQYTA